MSSAPGKRRRVEAAELVEQVGAHEHRRVRHEEHVAHAVVLFLVDLVGLDPRERHAVVVDRHADLEQDVGVVVVDELRADDRRVRPVRLLDHHAAPRRGRARRRRGRRAGTSRPRPRRAPRWRRPRSRGSSREPAHEGARQHGRDPGGRVLGGRCRARAPTATDSPGRRAPRACPRAAPGVGGDDDGDDGRHDRPGLGRSSARASSRVRDRRSVSAGPRVSGSSGSGPARRRRLGSGIFGAGLGVRARAASSRGLGSSGSGPRPAGRLGGLDRLHAAGGR